MRSLPDLLLVEEGRLPCGSEQSLPIFLLRPQAVLIGTQHLLDGHHRNSVLQMANSEVSVPTHQALDTAKSDLAK